MLNLSWRLYSLMQPLFYHLPPPTAENFFTSAPGVCQAKPVQKASWGVSFKRVMCSDFLSLFSLLELLKDVQKLNCLSQGEGQNMKTNVLVFQRFSGACRKDFVFSPVLFASLNFMSERFPCIPFSSAHQGCCWARADPGSPWARVGVYPAQVARLSQGTSAFLLLNFSLWEPTVLVLHVRDE